MRISLLTISPLWNLIQWASTSGFIIATVMMISPLVASTAITPWVIYFISNFVWLIDSIIRSNWPYATLSLFFCVWDMLLILSRVGSDIFVYIQPLITLLERLP